jgi:hypothetical protein
MDQVGKLVERPRLYCNIDGVGELGIGFMLLGFALLQWLQVRTPEGAIWHRMDTFCVYVGSMCLAIHYGSKAIKKHVTWPRTGFVAYRASQHWVAAAIAAPIGALVAVGMSIALRRRWDFTTPGALIGLGFVAVYAYGFARTVRWKWIVAGVMALGSLVIAFLPANLIAAVANDSWVTHLARAEFVGAWLLSMTFFGAILFVSGGISFWLYLRHTQVPAEEGQ